MSDERVLIRLEDLTKVFYTDEVETHALSGIHLDDRAGRVRRDRRARRAAASRRCSRSSGLLDSPTDGSYLLNGAAGAGPRRRASARASATARSASSSRAST